jgi:perosamine synthetase
VRYVGAWPVFVGCDDYCCLDATAVRRFLEQECERQDGGTINRATGRRVTAIVPVHVFGTAADMDALQELAAAFDLVVIEDASEALGSRYKDRMCGSLATLACLSFNGNKIVTSGGGGAILTGDAALARRARYLTTQAKGPGIEYIHDAVGYNYRMNNLLAALGLAQLETIGERLTVKRRNLREYEQALGPRVAKRLVGQPDWSDANRWFYGFVCDDTEQKDALLAACGEEGIQARPLWYPNHLQRPYLGMQAFEVGRAVWFYERLVNLPCSVTLTAEQVETVAAVIRRVVPA